ncbi:hypothetical protein AAC03nite_26790 [Alicyclobacillus acidoterrestris]|uniref:AAA family ATPase n=1 Tax=Alicyclobacillus suci TaxID=2816080 RepID=UPI001194E8F3|nr:AAA family ATPase [Alicyclobacillus suci]GEO26894.1 hypothetical protein AAC03nite_26790 [Alicyclobacillus acidoterrestris]
MRLQGLWIDHVGPYRDFSVTFHSQGLQVLYGRNEAGKSSMLAAIRGGLFGVARLAEGTTPVRPGAHVRLQLRQESGKLVTLERSLGRRAAPRLTGEDGKKGTGQGELAAWFPEFAQVEQVLYETFFTLQLADLVAFSEKPNALISQLFGLRALLINPYELEAATEKAAGEIFNPSRRASRPRLNQVLRAHREVAEALQTSPDRAGWYRQTLRHRDEVERELVDVRNLLLASEQRRDHLERVVSAYDAVQELLENEAKMAALGPVPAGNYEFWVQVPTWLEQQAGLADKRQHLLTRKTTHEHRLHQMQRKAADAELQGDVQAWQLRVQALEQSIREWIARQEAVRHAKAQLARARASLPSNLAADAVARLAEMTPNDALYRLADAYSRAVATEMEASRQRDAARAWEAEQREVFREAVGADYSSESHARAAIEERAVQLREIESGYRGDFERLRAWRDEMVRQPRETAGDFRELGMRAAILAALGAGLVFEWVKGNFVSVFVFAIALALTLLGMGFNSRLSRELGGNYAKKPPYMTRWKGPVHVDSVDDVLADILAYIQETELERQRLERVKSLLGSYEEAAYRRRLRDTEWQVATNELQAVANQYKAALNDANFPMELWMAADWAQFAEAARNVTRWRAEVEETCRAVQQLGQHVHAELQAAQSWLDIIHPAHDAGFAVALEAARQNLDASTAAQWAVEALQETLNRLSQIVASGVEANAECARLTEQLDAWLVELQMIEEQMIAVEQQIHEVYRQFGVDDRDGYERCMEREAHRRALQVRRERALQALVVQCSGETAAFRVVQMAARSSLSALQEALIAAEDEVEQKRARVAALQEELWSLDRSLEMSRFGEQGRALRWQAEQLEADIAALKAEFAAQAIAKALSVRARMVVEAHQSSPLLANASDYLARITDGRYCALRVPLGSSGLENVYLVDAAGQAFALSDVSRGTREQVYLALRLAVIRQYRERGVILPVILDDPLVNFDDTRAGRVLALLAEEAQQQPILYLTCHERLLDDIQQKPDVHVLPMQ